MYRVKKRKEPTMQKREMPVPNGFPGAELAAHDLSNLAHLTINKINGRTEPFERDKVYTSLKRACIGLESEVSVDLIMQEVTKNIYNQASTYEVQDAMILAATAFVERDPAYSKVAARLLLQKLTKEVIGKSIKTETYEKAYRHAFIEGIKKGVGGNIFDARMLDFDLEKLSHYLMVSRDDLFEYLGLRTLYERYFIKVNGKRVELPQVFWMRVAMGLALLEEDKNQKAIEFYELISSMRFVP